MEAKIHRASQLFRHAAGVHLPHIHRFVGSQFLCLDPRTAFPSATRWEWGIV